MIYITNSNLWLHVQQPLLWVRLSMITNQNYPTSFSESPNVQLKKRHVSRTDRHDFYKNVVIIIVIIVTTTTTVPTVLYFV